MSRFLAFSIPAVTFNFQNPSFIPAYFMALFIGMFSRIPDDGKSPKTQ
jgi:hypothetical protein